mgnify:CR=1 FL=1
MHNQPGVTAGGSDDLREDLLVGCAPRRHRVGPGRLPEGPAIDRVEAAQGVVDGAQDVTVSFADGTTIEDVAVRAFDLERDMLILAVTLPSQLTAIEPLTAVDDPESMAGLPSLNR